MTKIWPDCDATVHSTSQPDSAMTDLTPEHKLLCDVAAVKVHLDKYSRIEQRALLSRVMEHLNAVVETQRIAASQPNRMGTTAAFEWRDGAPAKPWSLEWFIAETTFGDRVCLVALPDEWTYDFKTADDTYIKADKIKRWMQFPDSEFIAPAALAATPAVSGLALGWLERCLSADPLSEPERFEIEWIIEALLSTSPPEQPAADSVVGEWQDIETIPQDRPIDGWHKVWKCPVTIAYRSWGDRNAWVEKTLTTEWPIEAFTHWRETSAAPETQS